LPLEFFSGTNDVIQETLELLQLCRHPKKSSNPKPSQFLSKLQDFARFRGFEQLSSSIGC